MNILFVTKEIPYPPNYGSRMRTWNILKILCRKHNVTLVCFGSPEDKGLNVVRAQCQSVFLVPSREQCYGRLQNYGRILASPFFRLPHIVRSKYSPAMAKQIAEIIADNQIEYVFCDSVYSAINIKNNSVRKILNEHNVESIILSRANELKVNTILKRHDAVEIEKMRRFETATWRRFDRCFVCSKIDQAEIIRRSGNQNVDVVPNGMDMAAYRVDHTRERPHCLAYTGQMGWGPNVDAAVYFVKAVYPLIKTAVPEVCFNIVGSNPADSVKALAGADPSITVTGYVDDVRPYVQESRVFVVPLRIGGGTRLKILEAMAMGKAVVSTSVGCEGLDVTDGENILIADDPADFAHKVAALMADAGKARALGGNGRRLVERKYSWDVIAETIDRKLAE